MPCCQDQVLVYQWNVLGERSGEDALDVRGGEESEGLLALYLG